MKSTQANLAPSLLNSTEKNTQILPLTKTKNPYFTHIEPYHPSMQEAAELYIALSIIPMH